MNLIHTTVSARRGSVSWLRLDQTENSNPNIDTGPMNTTPASLTRGGMCSKGASFSCFTCTANQPQPTSPAPSSPSTHLSIDKRQRKKKGPKKVSIDWANQLHPVTNI